MESVSGYVLAGGKSSRMGTNKALLEIAGKPLIARAVDKLRRVCDEVHILGTEQEFGMYGPTLADLHGDCGPLGGIEAALATSSFDWNLFLPVDMPFLPAEVLAKWIETVTKQTHAKVSIFTVSDVPQPAVCLLHRDVTPFVEQAVQLGKLKVYPVLMAAGRRLASQRDLNPDQVFVNLFLEDSSIEREWLKGLSERQKHMKDRWFTNLNTPEEFAEAGRNFEDALD